ncbi:mannosyltransferase putative-domain-containing protein [Xylariaceae sp. FL1019]|nr:mannosyltransferase putative-domain-containing protein [Xylariaceae sp. FL1019]
MALKRILRVFIAAAIALLFLRFGTSILSGPRYPDLILAADYDHAQKPTLASYLDFLNVAHPSFKSLKLNNKGWNNPRYRRAITAVTPESKRLELVTLGSADHAATRDAHQLVVSAIPKYEPIVTYKRGTRGIVTIAGEVFTAQTLVSLRMLRRYNTETPVEIFLPEDCAPEASSNICTKLFPELNAKCIVLPNIPGHSVSRFAYKAFALLHSSFEDVLFLDADNFPIVDPSRLFESTPYMKTGLVTWPDFWESMMSPIYYDIASLPVDPMTLHAGSESGQIIINKKRHAATLLLATYYSIFGDKQYFILFNQGGHGEGDKDSWIHAAKALSLPYYQVREIVGELGGEVMEWFYIGILQADPQADYMVEQTLSPQATWRNATPGVDRVLVHHSWVKLNPDHIVRERHSEKRVGERMWGSREQTEQIHGFDLEMDVWNEVLWVACAVEKYLPDEKDRGQCDKVKEVWSWILEKEGISKVEMEKTFTMATDPKRKPARPSHGQSSKSGQHLQSGGGV